MNTSPNTLTIATTAGTHWWYGVAEPRTMTTRAGELKTQAPWVNDPGLSTSTIQRLTRQRSQELAAFQQRDLSQMDYVYLSAVGVHFNIRLEHERLGCLVLIGVRAHGRKERVAVGDGYRDLSESWSELLRDLTRQGAPLLGIGDSALGFWARCARPSQIAANSAVGYITPTFGLCRPARPAELG